MKVIAARLVAGLIFVVGGGALQIALWKKPGEEGFSALWRHPYLWFLYLLIALLISEHIIRWFKLKATK